MAQDNVNKSDATVIPEVGILFRVWIETSLILHKNS